MTRAIPHVRRQRVTVSSRPATIQSSTTRTDASANSQLNACPRDPLPPVQEDHGCGEQTSAPTVDTLLWPWMTGLASSIRSGFARVVTDTPPSLVEQEELCSTERSRAHPALYHLEPPASECGNVAQGDGDCPSRVWEDWPDLPEEVLPVIPRVSRYESFSALRAAARPYDTDANKLSGGAETMVSESVTVPSAARLMGRNVTFADPLATFISVIPYSEIYGFHPRSFNFGPDGHMYILEPDGSCSDFTLDLPENEVVESPGVFDVRSERDIEVDVDGFGPVRVQIELMQAEAQPVQIDGTQSMRLTLF